MPFSWLVVSLMASFAPCCRLLNLIWKWIKTGFDRAYGWCSKAIEVLHLPTTKSCVIAFILGGSCEADQSSSKASKDGQMFFKISTISTMSSLVAHLRSWSMLSMWTRDARIIRVQHIKKRGYKYTLERRCVRISISLYMRVVEDQSKINARL